MPSSRIPCFVPKLLTGQWLLIAHLAADWQTAAGTSNSVMWRRSAKGVLTAVCCGSTSVEPKHMSSLVQGLTIHVMSSLGLMKLACNHNYVFDICWGTLNQTQRICEEKSLGQWKNLMSTGLSAGLLQGAWLTSNRPDLLDCCITTRSELQRQVGKLLEVIGFNNPQNCLRGVCQKYALKSASHKTFIAMGLANSMTVETSLHPRLTLCHDCEDGDLCGYSAFVWVL